jgi:hypothetical protein
MQSQAKSHNNSRHKSRKRHFRWLIVLAGLGLSGVIAGAAGVIGAYYYVAPSLPAAETIRDIPLQIPLRIFSRDGYLIDEIGERRRILITYDEVPEHVVNAFVAAEDQRFWVHPGIDYRGLLRAAFQLVTTGDVQAGGSTLTQQLARSYFLSLDRTIERKFKEASLAVRIEDEFSKEQIMALFLNKMFFGQRAYGVAAAAQVYFNKPLEDLNVAEAATLAGVLPAPSRYNPVRSAANAGMRRGYVLGRMLDLDFIEQDLYDEAMNVPVESRMHGAAVELNAPYVGEMVRREMIARYGDATYTAGYQVVTTLDARLQRAANYALRNGLLEFTRRRGYRGPLSQFELTPEILATPFAEWPVEIRQALEQYAPGAQSCRFRGRVYRGQSRLSISRRPAQLLKLLPMCCCPVTSCWLCQRPLVLGPWRRNRNRRALSCRSIHRMVRSAASLVALTSPPASTTVRRRRFVSPARPSSRLFTRRPWNMATRLRLLSSMHRSSSVPRNSKLYGGQSTTAAASMGPPACVKRWCGR